MTDSASEEQYMPDLRFSMENPDVHFTPESYNDSSERTHLPGPPPVKPGIFLLRFSS